MCFVLHASFHGPADWSIWGEKRDFFLCCEIPVFSGGRVAERDTDVWECVADEAEISPRHQLIQLRQNAAIF